jgi:hypothetical protein
MLELRTGETAVLTVLIAASQRGACQPTRGEKTWQKGGGLRWTAHPNSDEQNDNLKVLYGETKEQKVNLNL